MRDGLCERRGLGVTRDGWACTEVCGGKQRWVNVRGKGCDHRCQGVSHSCVSVREEVLV